MQFALQRMLIQRKSTYLKTIEIEDLYSCIIDSLN